MSLARSHGLVLVMLTALHCQGSEGDLLLPRAGPDLLATPPQCQVVLLGGGDRCLAETAWKTQAEQACAARGLVPGSLVAFSACSLDGGTGYSQLKVACCPHCGPEQQGGGPKDCKSEAAWKAGAQLACSATPLLPVAQSFVFDGRCGADGGDGFRLVRYLCCTKEAPATLK